MIYFVYSRFKDSTAVCMISFEMAASINVLPSELTWIVPNLVDWFSQFVMLTKTLLLTVDGVPMNVTNIM